MGDVPSPARRHNNEARPPFEAVLFDALRAQLARVERENAGLKVDVAQLNATLAKARAWARTSNENWKLRRQAWLHEREELLGCIREHHAVDALDGSYIGDPCPICTDGRRRR